MPTVDTANALTTMIDVANQMPEGPAKRKILKALGIETPAELFEIYHYEVTNGPQKGKVVPMVNVARIIGGKVKGQKAISTWQAKVIAENFEAFQEFLLDNSDSLKLESSEAN